MRLILIRVKGSMEEAQAELTKRNILFKFGRAFDASTTIYNIPLVEFLVHGRFAQAIFDWYDERRNVPVPPGTLLLFIPYEDDGQVEKALQDFRIAPYVGTDFPDLPQLTRRQAETLCKTRGAIAFDDYWIVRNKLTGEVIQGDINKKRATASADTLNNHEEANGRQRVFVSSEII